MQGQLWFVFDSETQAQSNSMSMLEVLAYLLQIKPTKYKNIFLWTPGWDDWISLIEFSNTQKNPAIQIKEPIFNKLNLGNQERTVSLETQEAPQGQDSKQIEEQTSTDIEESPYTEVNLDPTKQSQDKYGSFFRDIDASDLSLEQINNVKVKASTINKLNRKPAANISADERRKDPRYRLKIEVIIMGLAGSFRSNSIDISLSGTKLEDPIPKAFHNNVFDVVIVNPFEPKSTNGRLVFQAKIVGDMTDPRRLEFRSRNEVEKEKLSALLRGYLAYQQQISNKDTA